MTKLLEKAFKRAAQLPEEEQNTFAEWMLEELASEKKWNESFSGSEDVLTKLANEALNAHKNKQTTELDINKL